jgi:hypothetical protein
VNLLLAREDGPDFSIYLSKPGSFEGEEGLQRCGSIQGALGNAILNATQSGFNSVTVGDVSYRFTRTFAPLGGSGAVLFAPV